MTNEVRPPVLKTDPKRLDEADLKAVQRVYEESNDEIRKIIDEGAATLALQPPRVRLEGYLSSTLVEDLMLVLAADEYWEGRMDGTLAPLKAETLLAQYEVAKAQADQMQMQFQEQAMMAQQQGMAPPQQPQTPQLPPEPPKMWPLLIRVDPIRGEFFLDRARDFRRLYEQQYGKLPGRE